MAEIKFHVRLCIWSSPLISLYSKFQRVLKFLIPCLNFKITANKNNVFLSWKMYLISYLNLDSYNKMYFLFSSRYFKIYIEYQHRDQVKKIKINNIIFPNVTVCKKKKINLHWKLIDNRDNNIMIKWYAVTQPRPFIWGNLFSNINNMLLQSIVKCPNFELFVFNAYLITYVLW